MSRSSRKLFIAMSATVSLTGATASATPYDTLASVAGAYNLFLLGNLGTAASPYASSVQGSVAVAGNAYTSGAAIDTGFSGTAAAVVGGNLVQSGGIDDGNVFVGGQAATFSGGATVLGSVTVTSSASTLTYGNSLPPTGIYVTPTTIVNVPSYMTGFVHTSGGVAPPLDVFGSSTDIVNASNALGALPATAVLSSGGVLTVTLSTNGLNVIDVTLPDGATVTGVNIVTASGASPSGAVLNIAGNNLKFSGGSYSTGTLTNSAVLYNFTNATSLSLSSLAFEGTLLAPLATVSFTNGRIDGSLIAANLLGNAAIDDPGYSLTLPAYSVKTAAVSEPSTGLILLAPLAALIVQRRRKQKADRADSDPR